MVCNKCGNVVPNNAVFCTNCGASLNNVPNGMQNNMVQNNSQNNKNNKKKKSGLLIFIVLVVVIVAGVFGVRFIINKFKSTNDSGSPSTGEVLTSVKDENGNLKFISGKFSSVKVEDEDDAFEALNSLKNQINFKDVNKEFKVSSTESSGDITYYKFQQIYKDIEVYGNNLVISVDKNGNVLSMSGYYEPNISVDVNNFKSVEEIENVIKTDLKSENVKFYETTKYVYREDKIYLVYHTYVSTTDDIMEYMVDASTGDIIYKTSAFEAAAYEFKGQGLDEVVDVTLEEYYDTMTFKNRYRIVDPNRNIVIADGRGIGADAGIFIAGAFSSWSPMFGDLDGINFKFLNGEGGNKEIAEIAISALKRYEDIYDYYYKVLGRKSYDNKGSKIVVNVGIREKTFGKEKYNNAFWDPLTKQMFIGYWNETSFVKSLDVLAHEFTHGVVSKTAKFTKLSKDKNKPSESGALSEGFPDILGSLIEGKNWTINENLEVLRSLENPNSYKNPSVKGGEFYYPDGYLGESRTLEQFLKENNLTSVRDYDEGGVHHNSTVVGHAAYLMFKDGAFSSREEMAKVWYNALLMLSSSSDFEDCALAVIESAKNMKLSSSSISTIQAAFYETKMLDDTRPEISGKVTDDENPLTDVKIELERYNNKDAKKYTFKTNDSGEFNEKVEPGVYKIKFSKDGYQDYNKVITINGNTIINVKLSKGNNIEPCKSGNCHIVTMYYLEGTTSGIVEKSKSFSVDDGSLIGIDMLNKLNKTGFTETDGKTFKVTIAGFSIDCAWYYKDTDTIYDFTKPVTEDVELEMKILNGLIDNDFVKDVDDIFSKYR